MIQKSQQHTLELLVHFPIMGGEAKVAAEAPRFVETGRRARYYADGEDAVLMASALAT